MNTTLITHKLVHRSVNIPYRRRREQVCTAQGSHGEQYPALDESKRELHKPCGGGSSAPPIKADNVCSRQPGPIRTSDPRGYNTGNVPPSYGPEDGNLYGDASHREAEDESATVSKNMRRVPQNEAPAHGFSGGRTAQGTMSRSPEAAAQSGKAYYQEPDR